MIVVVGAGLSGLVIAERLARSLDEKILVLERRDHLAGNCHDGLDRFGNLVPTYGPHYFHTEKESVWTYLSQFTEWHPYEHRVKSWVNGALVPVPVNIETVNTLLGLKLETPEQMRLWLDQETEGYRGTPGNSEEAALGRVGPRLYELLFKHYTRKQWDCFPAELDPLVMNRIPVRQDFEDRYFTDRYQAMPLEGYTALAANMVRHPNIEVQLKTDYADVAGQLKGARHTFFTGRIDEYFHQQLPRLQYRSLRFEVEEIPMGRDEFFQAVGTVNYPLTEAFTRISEPKHSNARRGEGTSLIREYPIWGGEPYYPVFDQKNQDLFAQYSALAARSENRSTTFVGRLANYKYFNMDAAVDNALQAVQRFLERP